MSTLVAEVRAQSLVVTEDSLIADLSDGRSITVPLAWYPRLVHGTPEERSNWRWKALIGGRRWLSRLNHRHQNSFWNTFQSNQRIGGCTDGTINWVVTGRVKASVN